MPRMPRMTVEKLRREIEELEAGEELARQTPGDLTTYQSDIEVLREVLSEMESQNEMIDREVGL